MTVTVVTTSYVEVPEGDDPLLAEDLVVDTLLAIDQVYMVEVQRTIQRT